MTKAVAAKAFHWTIAARPRHAAPVFVLLALLSGLFAATPGWAMAAERIEVRDGTVVVRFDGAVLPVSPRVVIDVAGKAGAVAKAPRGTRLVLDLENPGDGAAAAAPAAILPWIGQAKPGYVVSQPVPPARKALPLPRVKGDAQLPLVVIDAGHGGVDPGAINPVTGLREKDVTLAIARAIRDKLIATGRVRAALTREDDRYILHRERFGIARRLHADLFISIHCDSVASGSPTGATAYTLSDVASDKEAALLAARENKADVIAGVNLDRNADVSSILIDLTQRETMNASAGFARLLGREAGPLMPTKANFHRTASLLVLKAPDMPSILFETGYISTPQDAAFLDSREGRDRIAESVKRAVEIHFARRMASR